ncbi:hypothetical protein QUF58_10255 [Anaerolineales bacterium HSG24]|nr:hypothetical protein [Anaerolineales bacterium HSG24]
MTKQNQTTIGEQLCTALTQIEIADLLTVTVNELSPTTINQMLSRLPLNTRQTIEQVLTPEPTSEFEEVESQPKPVSIAKLEEEWKKLWKEWDEIVFEASLENGKYVLQDEHWEPPYFDEDGFVEDLDKVAFKLRPLLDIAFEHNFQFADEGFAEAVEHAENEAGSELPEWIEIVNGFCLENNLSYCILQWEWLTAMADEESAFEFAETIRQLENKYSQTSLSDDTLTSFFTTLPENHQRVIYDGLTAHKTESPWDKRLQNIHSVWHSMYVYWLDQYNPAHYLETMRTTISQEWRNGLPVIEDYLNKKAYQDAAQVLTETVDSMLTRRGDTKTWLPEEELLYPIVSYRADADAENYKKLLRYYQQIAKSQGDVEREHALTIQLIAFDKFYDWQAMFTAFAEVPVSENSRYQLFQSWQEAILKQSNPQAYHDRPDKTFWAEWLLYSIFDEEKGPAWFQQKLNDWLQDKPSYTLLRMLTNDVSAFKPEMIAPYPKFRDVVFLYHSKHGDDYATRQLYLKQYISADTADQLMSYWKANIHRYVPNPKNVHKANYTDHAAWMGVLKELSPARYDTLLTQWQTEHHRRRNLWKAMREQGLM